MATHDYVIANGTGAAVRSDLNDALAAIVSNNSGSSEPATTYAFQWWADTTANVLKIRNSANNGWITLRELDGTLLIEDGTEAAPSLSFATDLNTGLFRSAENKLNISAGGAERLEIGSSEVVFNDPSNDVDFRVESNGQTHMLFVDAGNDRVGIGTSSPGVLVDAAGSNPTLRVRATTSNTEVSTLRLTEDNSYVGAYVKYDGSTNLTHIGTHSAADSNSANDNNAITIVRDNRRVGIGTTSPAYNLSVESTSGTSINIKAGTASTARLRFGDSGDDDIGQIIYDNGGNSMRFHTNAAERFRVDSSGNFAIGTSSPTSKFDVEVATNTGINFTNISTAPIIDFKANSVESAGRIRVNEASGGGVMQFATKTTGGTITEAIRIDSSQNVNIGSNISSNPFTYLRFGASQYGAADIRPTNEGSHKVGLSFYTDGTQDTTINPTEAMRLDSSGRLMVGTTSPGPTAGKQLTIADSANAGITIRSGTNAAGAILFEDDTADRGEIQYSHNGDYMRFKTAGTERMRISHAGKFTAPTIYSLTTTGGGPVYVESDGDLLRYTSSLKYKTDVETIEDARADAILNCRPVWYRSKCDNDIKTEGSEKSDWGWYGFIAEEVAEIEPRLVNWATKDGVKQEDGSVESVERDPADYEAEGVRYDNFVPLLVNLVKRQQAAIATLEAKVAALEAG